MASNSNLCTIKKSQLRLHSSSLSSWRRDVPLVAGSPPRHGRSLTCAHTLAFLVNVSRTLLLSSPALRVLPCHFCPKHPLATEAFITITFCTQVWAFVSDFHVRALNLV